MPEENPCAEVYEQLYPKWKHPLDSKEGRIERAVWIFKQADGKMQMGLVIEYLKKKGCTEDEITEAMNTAGGGTLVATALGDFNHPEAIWKCAGKTCNWEGPLKECIDDENEGPICPRCKKQAFPRDDGQWPKEEDEHRLQRLQAGRD